MYIVYSSYHGARRLLYDSLGLVDLRGRLVHYIYGMLLSTVGKLKFNLCCSNTKSVVYCQVNWCYMYIAAK